VYKGYRIEFDDGREGVVDFTSYLKRGGSFDRLRDIEFFKRFSVNEDLGGCPRIGIVARKWGSEAKRA
jgi:hypothetical protein